MSPAATKVYDTLNAVRVPLDEAIASLLGATQGTAPADRWQHCAQRIDLARRLLDEAANHLAIAAQQGEDGTPAGELHWHAPGLRTTTMCQGEPLAPKSFAQSESDVTCPACLSLLNDDLDAEAPDDVEYDYGGEG